eukprot:SAG11_NODE_7994_length_1072_cov_1.364851_2_plen_91_part_00
MPPPLAPEPLHGAAQAGEFDLPTFEAVLRFCYGAVGPELVDERNAVKLLCVADAWMLEDLRQLCEAAIEFDYLVRRAGSRPRPGLTLAYA